MADPFRYQVVSVGLWRGKIKRWNTTIHYARNDATSNVYGAMNNAGYPNPGDTTGACSGGIASISVYNPSGGTPIVETTYFDWQNPAVWIPFTGGWWGSVPAGTPLDSSGESAAIIVGHLPTLSASGKPVTTRKYLHAVPSRTATDYSTTDISVADASAIATGMQYFMTSPSGEDPSTVTCNLYYGNHQRVRGRRRTVRQVASQSFSAGVVAGAGATASGGSQPFQ